MCRIKSNNLITEIKKYFGTVRVSLCIEGLKICWVDNGFKYLIEIFFKKIDKFNINYTLNLEKLNVITYIL